MLGLLDRATKLTSPQGEPGGLVRGRKPGEGLALVTFVIDECPRRANRGQIRYWGLIVGLEASGAELASCLVS
jgi:hypothetical protein